MPNIEVIALDIYGTLLATDDADGELNPRKGAKKFFKKCQRRRIKVVTASDEHTTLLKTYLEDTLGRIGLGLDVFDKFFHLHQLPHKDFTLIIQDYRIKPAQLLVIGDNPVKDIQGAINCGAHYIQVPEFLDVPDNYDLSCINF
jgi:FMN phosphatase YigB (HAD superfamily)